MQMYFAFGAKYFQKNMQYRLNHFINNIASIFFAYVFLQIWTAIYRGQSEQVLEGYNFLRMFSYVVLNQAILWISTFLPYGLEIPKKVRTGNIVMELMRPVNFYLMIFAQMSGNMIYNLVFRSFPIFIFFFLFQQIILPTQLLTWLIFTYSLILAFIIGFNLNMLEGMSAFWFVEMRGLRYIYYTLTTLFSGYFIPLEFYPGFFQKLVLNLPFIGMSYIPVTVFMESYSVNKLFLLLLRQSVWAMILTLITYLITKKGQNKVQIQGG